FTLLPHLPIPPPSPLFPYTTLFRSYANADSSAYAVWAGWHRIDATIGDSGLRLSFGFADVSYEMDEPDRIVGTYALKSGQVTLRSEEHTSELQSPDHLVCRLLLEKK